MEKTRPNSQTLALTGFRLGRPTVNASHSPPAATETSISMSWMPMEKTRPNSQTILSMTTLRLGRPTVNASHSPPTATETSISMSWMPMEKTRPDSQTTLPMTGFRLGRPTVNASHSPAHPEAMKPQTDGLRLSMSWMPTEKTRPDSQMAGIRLGRPTDNASHSTPSATYWAIYVMDADGKNLTQLTDLSVDAWAPSWSPDGQRIAFTSSRDGDAKIYVIYLD